MPQVHITTILRPRGRYKCFDNKQQQKPPTTAVRKEAQVNQEISHSEVQLIRTIEFVVKQPPPLSCHNVVSSLNSCCKCGGPKTTATMSTKKIATTVIATTVATTATATVATTKTDAAIAITAESSDPSQSIEEEIEESIEVSEELSEAHSGKNAASSIALTQSSNCPRRSSSKLSDAAGSRHESKSVLSASTDAKFKIDDDQLVGGQLAQHFIINDDDDNDDDGDDDDVERADNEEDADSDFNISLPMDKNSADDQAANKNVDDANNLTRKNSKTEVQQPESLTNESTADDVSDFMDDARLDEEAEASLSGVLDVPCSDNARRSKYSISEHGANKEEEEDGEDGAEKISRDLSERDNSIEEIIESNQSIEMSFDDKDLSSWHGGFDMQNDTMVNRLLSDTPPMEAPKRRQAVAGEKPSAASNNAQQEGLSTDTARGLEEAAANNRRQLDTCDLSHLTSSKLFTALEKQHRREVKQSTNTSPNPDATINNNSLRLAEDEQDDEDYALESMKLRILAMKQEQQHVTNMQITTTADQPTSQANNEVKQMERLPATEFTKDVLEDITEESERNSTQSMADDQQTLSGGERTDASDDNAKDKPETGGQILRSHGTAVAAEVLQKLEQKISSLQQLLSSKDACLAALHLQLETVQRNRDSNGGSSEQPLSSSRDTSSLVTNSTEYRTLQEDLGGGPIVDLYMELTKRDELVAKLTDSLQKSLRVRERLQTESDNLGSEVQQLRKQLSEAMDAMIRPAAGTRDQESNAGQRISQISMELISESDTDDDDEEFEGQLIAGNESKMSRQLPKAPQPEECCREHEANENTSAEVLSKQLEQFQKYLTPNEVPLLLMVQKKFDDFMCEELKKCKMKHDHDLRHVVERLESEKKEKAEEIKHLQQQNLERDKRHSKEMEDLRKYFEDKCADLEKQYSDEVSLKTQQLDADSSSEVSEQEQRPDEVEVPLSVGTRATVSSLRKRTRAELLLSPSYRQMTPGGDAKEESANVGVVNELADMKTFYQNKIHNLQRDYEKHIRKLNERLKYFESRYPEDDFMPHATTNAHIETTELSSQHQSITTQVRDPNTSLIIIDQDELSPNNDSEIIQKIIEEYEKRLQEQLSLARNDIVLELENQIQALLAENTADDHYWPPELVLLREKFTAKSQLEIAQLQIKHEGEMSRLKIEYEKQLNRKNKRHSTFDLARDFDQIIGERDGLRELSKTFRHVLAELARCVLNYEDDLNATLVDEMEKWLANRSLEDGGPDGRDVQWHANNSSLNSTLLTQTNKYMPAVHSLLEVIEDPNLKDFVGSKNCGDLEDFDLNDCLEKLKAEAACLLQLSEELLHRRHPRRSSESSGGEKNDSCCEADDGLKTQAPNHHSVHKFLRANSLNEQQLVNCTWQMNKSQQQQPEPEPSSLPPNLNRLHTEDASYSIAAGRNTSELNVQLRELKNRLLKSETDRSKLQHELEHTIRRNAELAAEMQTLRDQLDALNRTDYAEGYGLGTSMKSPQREAAEKSSASFAQLQERARNILSTPTQQQQHNATVVLLQMIEDFCREGDKVVELNRKDREDLQAQIIAADKQLRAIRQFLEEQAVEREQERDEFLREIEHLKSLLRDKEKERSTYEHASKEVEQQETQLHQLAQKLAESNAKCAKFEVELKASIDKIFVLREIISELETQVETKTHNEHALEEKVKQLENFVSSQSRSNDDLQHEVQSLKGEISDSYKERIRQLEEKLQNTRPPAEQSMVLDQIVEQLRDIEITLDEQTKALEQTLQNSSNSCSLSVTEDVSARGCGARPPAISPTGGGGSDIVPPPPDSPLHLSLRLHSLSMDAVQRISDKLAKHTRVEEATIKRMRDFEMQISKMKGACVELQQERDSLQERMSEQMQRISALQSRLEEQRQRAEVAQRAGTSDLQIRIHDLKSEVQTLQETLSARDKQIANMRQKLEKSRVVIDRLEAELAAQQNPDRSVVAQLEKQLQQRDVEVQMLKEKIKSDMLNQIALPDLMQTMLADKNEEIDHLKQQLEAKDRERNATAREEASTKLSARTLSDILSISEFDEPDVIRRAEAAKHDTPLLLSAGGSMQQTMETSKEVVANLTHRRTKDLDVFAQLRPINTFDNPHYFQDTKAPVASSPASGNSASSFTPPLVPRQINFSALTDDCKEKASSTPLHEDLRHFEARSAAQITALQQQATKAENDLLATQQQLTDLQEKLHCREHELAQVEEENRKLSKAQEELSAKCTEIEPLLEQVSTLTAERNLQSEALTKQEKELANYRHNEEKYLRRLAEQEERIAESGSELTNLCQQLKSLQIERAQCKETSARYADCKEHLNALNLEIKAKDERLLTLTNKLSIAEDTSRQLQQQATAMEQEIEKLRSQQQQQQQQQQQSDNSSRQFSVDEIARQLEKELNYSAQLDSNILKAIESEEENNLDGTNSANKQGSMSKDASIVEQHIATDDENFTGERELLNQLEALRIQIAVEREHAADIRQELQAAKQHSQDIQEQDVVVIEAMRLRLEKALAKEDELHKLLDQERDKSERLQTQLTVLQRSDSRRNSALMKSPNDSPRRSPRGADFDSDLAERLRGEIKLLTAQQERERERHADLQHNLERERARFETELQDRIAYSERLKQEMERMARDKELAEQEVEHLQERLLLQAQEIESLEARIATMQEAETRRLKRRDQHLQENAQNVAALQELRGKLEGLETERDNLSQTVKLLRFDLERSAARETKLAEALAKANSNSSGGAGGGGEGSIPQQFLQKMKDINMLLAENTKENRQMAETVQFLVEERRQLQKKCEELGQKLDSGSNARASELEERCHHLLGRYLRVESHRKALVYQKRYLKISLQGYQESEARALAAMNGGGILLGQYREKRRLFKTVALAVIAIQRMKFIGRIWHTGKRIVSKSVFTITQQKRSQPPTLSCAAVSSTVSHPCDYPPTPTSPRYNLLEQRFAPLQTPALLSDMTTTARDAGTMRQWNACSPTRQQRPQQHYN